MIIDAAERVSMGRGERSLFAVRPELLHHPSSIDRFHELG
jgi:hypothetical protein